MTALPEKQDLFKGQIVQHLFTGRYATIEKIGRKYIHVNVHLVGVTRRWLPSSVRLP